jgi:hypothetical protein
MQKSQNTWSFWWKFQSMGSLGERSIRWEPTMKIWCIWGMWKIWGLWVRAMLKRGSQQPYIRVTSEMEVPPGVRIKNVNVRDYSCLWRELDYYHR